MFQRSWTEPNAEIAPNRQLWSPILPFRFVRAKKEFAQLFRATKSFQKQKNCRTRRGNLKKTQLTSSLLMKRSLTKRLLSRYKVMILSEMTVQLAQKVVFAFLVNHGLVVNKEFRNADFNIITKNEALAINLELFSNQNLTLATIYCPNGTPNFSLFQTISNLSDNVMFVGDFNSKLEAFGCASKNESGPVLKTIQNKLNLIYLNNDEHTRGWFRQVQKVRINLSNNSDF